jgi:hypothetical protein
MHRVTGDFVGGMIIIIIIRKMKDSIAEKTKERWHGKRMHGQMPRSLDEKLVDIEQSYRWLKYGDINP